MGQIVNLRRIGNPPALAPTSTAGLALEIGRRIANPPQVANLPHKKIVAGCDGF